MIVPDPEDIKKDSRYKLPLFVESDQRRKEPNAEPDREDDDHHQPLDKFPQCITSILGGEVYSSTSPKNFS